MSINKLPKPRPIEFMIRGHSLFDMRDILARWEGLTPVELSDLGFIPFETTPSPAQCSSIEDEVFRSRHRSPPRLQVFQGGRRSDQDSER